MSWANGSKAKQGGINNLAAPLYFPEEVVNGSKAKQGDVSSLINMEIVQKLPVETDSVIAIGVFDGVHLGHRRILSRAREIAEEKRAISTVVTFDPHPAQVLRPESAPALLTTISQRLQIFEELGMQRTYVQHFARKLAKMSPNSYVEEVLIDGLKAIDVVAGADFHFGFGRGGDMESLGVEGRKYGFDVEMVEMVTRPDQAEPVSSTAIRRALAGGQVKLAASMLGRPYAIEGKVIKGDQRGKSTGFPTANIPVSYERAWPADGVYAGWFSFDKGKRMVCAINIGRRPTFYEHAEHSVLEAHILDFEGDLYGRQVRIEFEEFIRSERRFKDVPALVRQLEKDVEQTRGLLKA